ncbi:protein TonB [Duganella sp. 1411]|uniref:energy transducer TonB n=1 Tax=Duganella sp. 1411 TaxID=2806572 RepID=UPI001B6FBEE7|nr:energy transducer TonB [Duganella sp. 1411]MBP1208306.1 protein TonB [Duganella sp. 1411]
MTYSRTAPSLSGNDAGTPPRMPRQAKPRGRRFAPLVAIVAGHALMFYAINTGMMGKIVTAVMPKVVTVTFVASPEPLKPAPPPPKTVPVVKLTPTYIPPMPVLATPQVEPTITVAPPAPRTNQPAAPAVAGPVAPAAPAPAVPSAPKTITGVEYIRAPQPVYPSIARRMGESGIVMLRVLIGEKGLAEQVTIQKSSGSEKLDEAGRQAVLRALYKPYIEDGKAIPVYALVPINFQLG